MKPLIITSLIFFILPILSYSQSDSWSNYFTGNEIHSLSESPNYIWAATECRIARISKEDYSVQFLKHTDQDQEACISYIHREIVATEDDHLWVGGFNNGLFYYNGAEWIHYDTIFGINFAVDLNNHLWFEGSNGNLFELYENTLHEYPIPGSTYNPIQQITTDMNAQVWMASEEGLIHFDGNEFSTYTTENSDLPADYLTSVYADIENNLWVSGIFTPDTTFNVDSVFLARYAEGEWTVFTESNSNLPQHGRIYDIEIDQNENIWLVTYPRLFKFDGDEWSVQYVTQGAYFTHSLVDLLIGSDNEVFLATWGKGLLKYNGASSDWDRVNTANSGLPGNRVKAIEFDESNTLWIGTSQYSSNFTFNQKGFASFSNDNWVQYNDPESNVPYDASSFTKDQNNNLWAANPDALYKLNSSDWVKYSHELYTVNKISADYDNNIWIPSGDHPIYKYNGSFTQYPIPGISVYYQPKSAGFGPDGSKWFGTLYRLAYEQGSTWTIYDYTNSGLPTSPNIQEIKFDLSNNLWIAGKGMVKYNGNTWTQYKTKNDGTDFNLVYCMEIAENGEIWFGTFKYGLLKFDQTNWIRFNTDNSTLLGNTIFDITFGPEGKIWVGTDCGLSVFEGLGGDTITVSNIITGLDEQIASNEEMSVFPNPFQNDTKIYIDIDDNEIPVCSIFSITGKFICNLSNYQVENGRATFALDSQKIKYPGIYILQVKLKNKTKIVKLVKQ
ncbi:MAG: T9SS type A sorting domain-containing protein [Bacteroidales bacterium]|nr:T9SS type A sorting domain-containing protein [Bacteroidales bacterium]